MKKQILTALLSLTIGISAFAGNGIDYNDRIVNAFKKDFASASEVQWEFGKTMNKATFKMNGQVVFAYYSQDAQLLALSRNITSAQLPINLFADLKSKYNQYWITELFEISKAYDNSYYITLENADSILILKSNGSSGWETYRKEKKEY